LKSDIGDRVVVYAQGKSTQTIKRGGAKRGHRVGSVQMKKARGAWRVSEKRGAPNAGSQKKATRRLSGRHETFKRGDGAEVITRAQSKEGWGKKAKGRSQKS